MSKRESLRAYQAELQEQMERARLAGTHEATLHVAFLAGGHRYLIDARNVLEAADSSPLVLIPGAKPWAVGVANIKGDAYAVTDFSALVGGPLISKGKFLTLDEDLMPGAALRVDRLLGLHGESDIGHPQPALGRAHAPWIVAAHEIAGETYLLVDADALIADQKFSNLQSGEHHDELKG